MSSFILTMPPDKIKELVLEAEKLINLWHKLFNLTGEDLALADKTKWCLAVLDPTVNKKPYMSAALLPYDLQIHHTLIPIHRIPPHHAERYLGVRIAVDGQMETELKYNLIHLRYIIMTIGHISFVTKIPYLVSCFIG